MTTTRSGDGSVTVAVRGEVDLATAGEFRSAIAAAVAAHPRVFVDLTATRYLDSAGVKVLYEFVGCGVEIVVAADGMLPRVISINGVDRALPVHIR